MANHQIIYEVFIIRDLVWGRLKDGLVHNWSWRQLNFNGMIAVYGNHHVDMQDAFCAAMAYRDRAGDAGILKINLDGVVPPSASGVRYVCDRFGHERGLRATG